MTFSTRRTGPLPAVAALAVAAGLVCASPAAQAWTFDEATGQLVTDGDVRWDCESYESLPEGLTFGVYNTDDVPFEADVTASLFRANTTTPLEGRGSVEIGGEYSSSGFGLEGLGDRFAGRRVQLNVWLQPRGTLASGRIYWYAGPPRDPNSDESPFRNYIGSIGLKPTGEVTSDGWRAYTTGPFDWEAAGVRPSIFSLTDEQFTSFTSYLLEVKDTHRVGVDAFEIVDLGPAEVPDATCTAATSADVCGSAHACRWGKCVDGAVLTNSLPDPRLRGDYLDRRVQAFRILEGAPFSQAQLPGIAESFDALVDTDSPIEFWSGIREGIARMQDGHASAPYIEFGGVGNLGVCMVQGEADLVRDPDTNLPLVIALSDSPVSQVLQVGDVLTAIDGQDPYAWLDTIQLPPTHYGDPIVADYVHTRDLISVAFLAGSSLTFERCPDATPCGAQGAETVTIDLADLVANVWADGVPDWVNTNVPCDFRFQRWVEDDNAYRYRYSGTSERDGMLYALVNGTPDPGTNEGRWGRALRDGFEGADPETLEGVILDHRSGGGGTVTGVNLIAGYLMDPEAFGNIDWFPYYKDGLTNAIYEATLRCQGKFFPTGLLPVCTGAYNWNVFSDHPDPGLHQDQPLAVVIGQDVSGNDFLTELMRYRTAPTRIFGSPATYGAFGTVVGLPPLLDEYTGGGVQTTDSFFLPAPYTPETELPDLLTGFGVPADEVIYQKQSDAIDGVDTVLSRAQQWLQEEQTP